MLDKIKANNLIYKPNSESPILFQRVEEHKAE